MTTVAPHIRLVHSVPHGCYMPWHLRGAPGSGPYAAACCFCKRDIGVPKEVQGKRVACIYCGLDHGLIPAVDVPYELERGL